MTAFLKRIRNWKYLPILLVCVLCLALFLILSGNGSASASSTEQKLTEIVRRIEGVGKLSVFVNEGSEGIRGVVIVCEGANDISVRLDVLNAVATALGISRSAITICEMK